MTQVQLAAIPYGLEISLLFGAILLSIGGVALIEYARRVRREEISRRVDRVVPRLIASEILSIGPSLNRIQYLETPGGIPSRTRREITRRLAVLRVPANRAMLVFGLMRAVAVATIAVLGYALGSAIPILTGQPVVVLLVAFGFGISGWFIPVMIANHLVKSRVRTVARGLPDALELLVVCVEAGLALEDGLERIVVEMRHSHPPLAEELAQTAADLKILPSRDQALANLAQRVDVPSVRSVVTTLSQTMRYGTPLAQAMRTVASEMRNDSLLALEERANKLPTLLTLPMMLFIMPTIFLIVGGPAALRLVDTFYR